MSPFAPGAVLANRYALDRKLGDDGLTEVWTATDRVLARQVVVEGASEEAGDAGRAAFRDAAAAAARLVHSGIVATYDSGVVDGAPYIITERPAGATLADLVARGGPLAPARVVVVGRQLARALQVAHGQGVTHGGVGPRTVLVTEDDRAKLSRFAACGARARLGAATAEKEADVHACAAALVTALVGSEGAVSPRAARSGVPPALDEVLVAAQEGGSITDAGALAAALDGLDIDDDAIPLVTAEPTPAMGTRVRPRPNRAPAARAGAVAGVAVGVLLAVAVGVAAFVLMSGGGSGNGPNGGPGTTLAGEQGRGGNLAVASAASFNPLGSGAEHPEALANLSDGNPSTTWATQTYSTPTFGGLKSGDGVYVTVGGVRALQQLTVFSPSRGWTFSVYTASLPVPTTLAGWGKPVGGPVTVQSDVTPVGLGGVKAQAVLVWITQLPANPPYRVSIGELAVR